MADQALQDQLSQTVLQTTGSLPIHPGRESLLRNWIALGVELANLRDLLCGSLFRKRVAYLEQLRGVEGLHSTLQGESGLY
jgi:hypothetical protein